MPLKKTPDGRWIRAAYRPEDYTIPAPALANLRACPYSSVEELGKHDGLLANYDRLGEEEHDGARWAVLRERSRGWIIDVELTTDEMGAIRPRSPEEAWRAARRIDEAARPPIGFEGSPPPGAADPQGSGS